MKEMTMSGVVDWSNVSTDDVLKSVQSAPKIMGAWRDCNDAGRGLLFYKEGFYCRDELWPSPHSHSAHVQPITPGPGWSWNFGYDVHGVSDTADEAKRACDAEILRRGWRLVESADPRRVEGVLKCGPASGGDSMSECTCERRFMYAEDYRDHLPCPGHPLALKERKRIVEWLRQQRPEGSGAWEYADGIEKGAHLRGH
jgi:hypothetical protein